MTEVDELEDEKLAGAVALKQGWKLYGTHWTVMDSGSHIWRSDVEDYRPDFSIAQAWELVEELFRAGHSFAINRMTDFSGIYSASFSVRDGVKWNTTSAQTAPIAICRAYLKIREGDTE